MPSSTSSFERAPESRWGIIFLISVLVAVSFVHSYETFWLLRGVEPNHTDDRHRWSYFRDQVDSLSNPNSTILVGASRMQLGWSLDTFRSMVPQTPILQLAVAGTDPMPILRDLSENTDFAGVLVVSMTPLWLFPGNSELAQDYVDFYANTWTPNDKINFLADNVLRNYLFSRHPMYGLPQTIASLETGRLPRGAEYIETTYEREKNADYQLANVAAARQIRLQNHSALVASFHRPNADEWDKLVSEFDQIVRPMVQRGARVVFIRFPTIGEHWRLDEVMFPRPQYWDDLASRVPGYWVHFMDIDGADQLPLPDTSHLDKRDKAEFTRLAVGALQNLGVY